MRGKSTRLLVACLTAGALAVPMGAVAQEAVDHGDKPGAEQAYRDKRGHERLSVDCRAFGKPGHEGVGCHWSPSKSREFAGYRLMRASRGEQPTTAFATGRRDETKAVDAGLARGEHRLYWVQAVDAAGEVIAQSNPVRVHEASRPERPGPAIALPGTPVL